MERKKWIRKISLKTKFTRASMVLSLVLCGTIILISFFSYRDSMFKRYEENITSLVHTAASFVPADKVKQYMESGQTDEDYERLIEQFRIIQKQNNLEFLYSYVPVKDGLYVFAQGTNPGDVGHFELGNFLGSDYYSAEELEFANSLFTNPDQPKVLITNGTFGYLITAFEVIKDANGSPLLVVGADMSMQVVNSTLQNYLILVIIVAMLIFAAFMAIYLLFLHRSLINPLQTIVDSAIDFVDTNTDENSGSLEALQLNVKTGDEIEILADAFNKMTGDITRYITELTNTASERERINTELRVATLIQEGMLPRNFDFPGRDEFSVYASMRPAKNVGGDFYDFFFVDEDHFCIANGDVSGKGVPAALFMAMAKATVKDLVLRHMPVNEVMTEANEIMCKNNDQGMFVTLLIMIINVKTGSLQWCDAGHNPAILWKQDGEVRRLAGKKGFVCAGMDGVRYKMNEDVISRGDILYLYTDGITEAINPEKQLYGENRLIALIGSMQEHNVRKMCAGILSDVDLYAGDEPQFDDITMLGFKFGE